MTTSYRSFTLLSVAVFALLSYNFMSASWTPSTGTPPANNTPAPVNVGSTTQAKTGNLSANIFAATTEMRSNRYCDALGNNCFSATSTNRGPNVAWVNVPSGALAGPDYIQYPSADERFSPEGICRGAGFISSTRACRGTLPDRFAAGSLTGRTLGPFQGTLSASAIDRGWTLSCGFIGRQSRLTEETYYFDTNTQILCVR